MLAIPVACNGKLAIVRNGRIIVYSLERIKLSIAHLPRKKQRVSAELAKFSRIFAIATIVPTITGVSSDDLRPVKNAITFYRNTFSSAGSATY